MYLLSEKLRVSVYPKYNRHTTDNSWRLGDRGEEQDGLRSNESVSRVIPREIPCWIETTENFVVRPRTSRGHRLFAGNRPR